MKYLCTGCERVLDSNTDLGYTLINNITGQRDVLCESCVRQIIAPKAKQINSLLREINEKSFGKKGEKKKL